jgi:hypothetical protein
MGQPNNLLEALRLDGNGKKLRKLDTEITEVIDHVRNGNPTSKLTITIEVANGGMERYTGAQQIEYTVDSKVELKKKKPNPTTLFADDSGLLTEWNPKQRHLPGTGSRARSAEELEEETTRDE